MNHVANQLIFKIVSVQKLSILVKNPKTFSKMFLNKVLNFKFVFFNLGPFLYDTVKEHSNAAATGGRASLTTACAPPILVYFVFFRTRLRSF